MSIELNDYRPWSNGWGGPVATYAGTVAAIDLAWPGPPGLIVPATTVKLGLQAIANALVFDCEGGMDATHAYWFVDAYLTIAAGTVRGRVQAGALPKGNKSGFSAALSCALTIATARKSGRTTWIGSVEELKKLEKLGIPVWTKVWTGPGCHGPDYVFCVEPPSPPPPPIVHDAWFVEVKGISSAATVGRKRYAKEKTQSLNATFVGPFPPALGHLLCYARLAPGVDAEVNVFNHRSAQVEGHGSPVFPYVALAQALQQLQNAGYGWCADALLEPSLDIAGIEAIVANSFERVDGFWVERRKERLRFALRAQSLAVFYEIARTRPGAMRSGVLEDLHSLGAGPIPPGLLVQGRSPTGAFIVGEHPYDWSTTERAG